MNAVARFFGQSFTMAVLSLVVIAVFVISLILVMSQILPPESAFWRDLGCAAGVPSQEDDACIQRELRKLEEQRRRERREFDGIIEERRRREAALEKERAGLEAARAKLEERIARMRAIEAQVSNFNLFVKRDYQGSADVHTGAEYPSFVEHQKWSSAWCYWNPPGKPHARVNLGAKTPAGGVSWTDLSDKELEAIGVSREAVEGAKRHCVWPEG